MDPWLLLAVLGLGACSLVTLAGGTAQDVAGQPHYYLYRQAGFLAVGLVVMFIVARVDYSRLREVKAAAYFLLVASILTVLALGGATRGSRRWIDLAFFRFQPSELGKLLLTLALAGFLVGRVRRLGEWRTSALAMVLAVVPALLVVAQPDLGTGIVYVAIAITALFLSNAPARHLATIVAVIALSVTTVLAVAPAAGVHVLKPYQVQRLTGFVSPSSDPRDQTYQIRQSLTAVGAGGRTGRGAAHATQTRLNFLPEHQTDFIFAVVGESYGFAGSALVLSLYALLIWRMLFVITVARSLFGMLIAGGVLAALMAQVFVNVGMTIGIMPITGVPLPLMSYGGSSVLVTLMGVGLLQSIGRRGRLQKS